jgi:hypothetical protein
VFAAGLLPSPAARAQQSRCADCHFSRPEAPAPNHTADWDRSPHGRNDVGCEKCHGGDATTFEPMIAHRDIIPPSAADSPVNRRNLPATCGACHAGPFVAFQASEHFLMLRNASRDAPTCSTCHGEVAGRILSAKALASRCDSCHGLNEVAPRARRAALARELYEDVAIVREQLKLARAFIGRIDDRPRRELYERAYRQAETPVTEAVDAGHKFEYSELVERLEVARERVSDLLERLANQPPVPQ